MRQTSSVARLLFLLVALPTAARAQGPAEPPPLRADPLPPPPVHVVAPPVVQPKAPPPATPAAPILADAPETPAPAGDAVMQPGSLPAEADAAAAPAGFGEALPTYLGPAGLLRLSTTDTGTVNRLRLGFTLEYFTAEGMLVERDQNTRLGGALAIGYTPLAGFEVFGAIVGSSNRNRRLCTGDTCVSEPGRRDPEVIKAFGDIVLGAKLAHTVSPGFALGGQAGARLLSSITGLSLDPSATSLFLDGLAGLDLRALADIPFRAHLNAGYYLDNSDTLQDYTGVPRPSKLVSSFAYGIAKSRVRLALGAEVPLPPLAGSVAITPFAEYHVEVVTAGADPAFDDFRGDANLPVGTRCGTAGARSCIDNRDQQWLTLGARAQLAGGGAFFMAVDLGTRKVGFPYGTPLPAWNLLLGTSIPFDVGATVAAPRVVTRTVVVEKVTAPVAKDGWVAGVVTSSAGGAPVANAVVSVVGRTHARVAVDPDGTFVSLPLGAGEVELEVTAMGFEPARTRTTIVTGQTGRIQVALTPREETSAVIGKLVGATGKPVAGLVRFVGVTTVEARADAAGVFSVSLPHGVYVARTEAAGFLTKETRLEVGRGGLPGLSFTVRARPAKASVLLRGGKLTVAPVTFQVIAGAPSATLAPASLQVLDEIVDLMVTTTTLRKLVVEAHWDNGLPAAKADELTKSQAQAIVDYLARQGIALDRLEASGLGSNKPRVPNLGVNRIKNRRVEFRVVD